MGKTHYEYHKPNIKGCKVDTTVTEQKINIQKRVQRIFDSLSFCYNCNGLIDTVKLARAFKFEVVEHKGLPALVNGIITVGGDGHQITINDNLSKDKKRYTIAYLLSTYLLYYQEDVFFIQKYIEKEEDLNAAYFTRLLLISESILLTMSPNAITNISDEDNKFLANMFQVPYDVMNKKIEDIKWLKGKNPIIKKTKERESQDK